MAEKVHFAIEVKSIKLRPYAAICYKELRGVLKNIETVV